MAQGENWGWWSEPERGASSHQSPASHQDPARHQGPRSSQGSRGNQDPRSHQDPARNQDSRQSQDQHREPAGWPDPDRHRGSVYRSAAASGDPDATLIMRPIVAYPPTPGLQEPPAWEPLSNRAPADAEEPPGGEEPAGEHGGGSAARNSAIMAVGSLVSRGTGFLRTAVLAAALGGGVVGDAFSTAQFFPGMIYELLLGGILGDFIVPVLVRARKSSPDRGQAFTQRLLTLAVISLGAATALAVLIAPVLAAIFSQDASDAKRHVITVLSYLIMPTIFFYGMSAVFGSVLYSRDHFMAPMWAPILNNLVIIGAGGLYIGLFGAKPVDPEQMTPARLLVVGGGLLLGIVIQSLGLWPALRRVGFRWKWRFDFRGLGLGELGRLSGWMFCYVGIGQVGIVILLYLLNLANSGGNHAGPMTYNNVYLLLMMAHGIVAVSIITALLPRMSKSAADGRYGDLAADLSRGTRTSVVVLAPIAICYVVLAQPAMITLFERGAYTRSNAIGGSGVLVIAGLALIPYAISQLLTFAFYALANTKAPAMISLPVTGLRVLLQVGVYLLFAASFTAAGLMIGNAVSYLLGVALSVLFLRPKVGRLGMRGIVNTLVRVCVAAAGAAVVGLVLLRVLPGGDEATRVQAAIQLVAGGIGVFLTYLVLAVLLRIHEINEVLALVRRRLPGR